MSLNLIRDIFYITIIVIVIITMVIYKYIISYIMLLIDNNTVETINIPVNNWVCDVTSLNNSYSTIINFKEKCDWYLTQVNLTKAYFDCFDYLNSELKGKHDFDFLNSFLYKNGSGGGILGSCIDGIFPQFLTNNSNFTWKHGEDTKDVDFICIECPELNAENKTCARETQTKTGKWQKQYINGGKTQAAQTNTNSTKNLDNDYHFYYFTAYHIPRNEFEELIINDIFIGMLKRSDWTCSKSDGSGSARVPMKIFNKQFFNIYHRERD